MAKKKTASSKHTRKRRAAKADTFHYGPDSAAKRQAILALFVTAGRRPHERDLEKALRLGGVGGSGSRSQGD